MRAVPGGLRNGTGFVVDDEGRVLTSHHVVAGCRLLAMRRGNARVGASLVSADRDADLALLLPQGDLPASPVSFRRLPVVTAGERVVVAGFPREVAGTGWLRAGSAEVVMPGDGKGRFRLSVPVEPGNSGGPVFDRAARVIGVAAGTFRHAATGAPLGAPGVAVAGDAVQGFLRRAGVAYRVEEGRTLGIRSIAERARDSTVLVECLRR
jgi:S1-C subfamily serine protease